MKTLRCFQYVRRLLFTQWCRCVTIAYMLHSVVVLCTVYRPSSRKHAAYKRNEKRCNVEYFFLRVYNNIKTVSNNALALAQNNTRTHTNKPKHIWAYLARHAQLNLSIRTMGKMNANIRMNCEESCVSNCVCTHRQSTHQKVYRQIYYFCCLFFCATKSKYAYTTRQCVVICFTFSMSFIFALAKTAAEWCNWC